MADPYANIIKKIMPGQQEYSKDYVNEFNMEIIAHLEGMAPYAQVALDLTVISGLAVLAMASVAQRGVQDINVLSAVSVWFLAPQEAVIGQEPTPNPGRSCLPASRCRSMRLRVYYHSDRR
jgi:hypothetical protein